MNISLFSRRLSGCRGFTLIELLVVISIIAVLAGLLLPVVNKVMENARKVETKTAEMQMVAAVKNFQTEYGQYPVPAPAAGATATDTTYDTMTGNAPVMNVLRNLESVGGAAVILNTRHIVYFEGKDAKLPTQPKSGFVTNASAVGNGSSALAIGDYVDSWGNRVCIRIDSNYTDAVANPYNNTNSSDTGAETDLTQVLRFGVVAWSYGSDGKIGTSSNFGDDVVSWQ